MAKSKRLYIIIDERSGEMVDEICISLDEVKAAVGDMDDHMRDADDGDFKIYELVEAPYQIVKGGWKVE